MSEQEKSLNQGSQPERKPGFNLPADSTSMAVGSQVPVSMKSNGTYTQDLAGRTSGHAGSNPAADAVLPSNPGPRELRGQSKVMSSKLDSPSTDRSPTDGSEGERA